MTEKEIYKGLKIAFVAGLSDKKLLQKLIPLEKLPCIAEILLFRNKKLESTKTKWVEIPSFLLKIHFIAEITRFFLLLLKASKCDVIVGCNQAYHGVMAWLAGLIFGKPVIQIATTDIDLVCRNPLLRRALLSSSSCAVRGGISLEKLKKWGYTGKAEILANEFSCPHIDSKNIQKMYDMIFVAHRTSDAKDFPWLIEVLKDLKKKLPGFSLAIVSGGHREKLQKKINESGLSENIIFTGELEQAELNKTYLQSKIMILTSKVEGFPMVIIEALSLGIPMVVTDVGDIPWLVQNGNGAILVKNKNTRQMVEAIESLLSNPSYLDEMGKKAKKRFEELKHFFEITDIAHTWERLINAALKKS